MNQIQREFIIKKVREVCEAQVKELKEQIPPKPSLNNYLITAFLDGTIKMRESSEIKKKIKERVITMGKDDALLEHSSWSRRDDEDEGAIGLKPADVLYFPAKYGKALAEWTKKKEEMEAKMKILIDSKDTIELKVQIGSDTVLNQIVEQVDSIGNLEIVNTKLLINPKGGKIK